MAANLDEPTISVREHVREVVRAERTIYRVLARSFAVHKKTEFTGQELASIFSECGKEDDDRINMEIGRRT
jgi:hypothetical protein